METHILNGDSLKERFPDSISGEIIVARECLVDGDVSGKDLQELYTNRADFLKREYGMSPGEYQRKTVTEFEKIQSISPGSVVNLWFEDDLFCQVNLWFVAHLISEHTSIDQLYLIRPNANLQFGFGGMHTAALIEAYQTRKKVSPTGLSGFNALWQHYRAGMHQEMMAIAENHKGEFPFLAGAVEANQERFPDNNLLGRPHRTLMEIMDKIGSDEFDPVFREFHEREAIYGFGDLQVKRLFEEIKKTIR